MNEAIDVAKGNIKRKRDCASGLQSTIEDSIKKKKTKISQEDLDEAILDVIIDDNLPRNIVTSPAFRRLASLNAPENVSVMCRDKVETQINQRFANMKENVKKILSGQSHVGTTADLWSKRRRFV